MVNRYTDRKKTVKIRIPLDQFQQWMLESMEKYIPSVNMQVLSIQKAKTLVQHAFQTAMMRKYSMSGEIHLEQYPLMSLEAQGKWRDDDLGIIVYVPASQKHRAYYRKWFIPINRRSQGQQSHRHLLKVISGQWKQETEDIKNAWRKEASNYPAMNGHNLYVKKGFEYFRNNHRYPELGFKP
jgi:hypothetical protein